MLWKWFNKFEITAIKINCEIGVHSNQSEITYKCTFCIITGTFTWENAKWVDILI